MLPGVIAGHYQRHEAEIDLPDFCARQHCQFIHETFSELKRLPAFDLLSINIGSIPKLPSANAAPQHEAAWDWPVKPFAPFLDRFESWLAQEAKLCQHIVVIGGGPASVEMALALRHRCIREQLMPRISLKSKASVLLPHFPASLRQRAMRHLLQARIEVLLGAEQQHLSTTPTQLHLWANGASPSTDLRHSGLPLTAKGFIAIDAYLRVQGQSHIFAVGDCANLAGVPKSGVAAVRQAPILSHNLQATLKGNPLKRFHMPTSSLVLMSLGTTTALGNKGSLSAEGQCLWTLKNHIDTRYVRRYQTIGQ
ncbi:MAG: hypothetical protein RLZZ502_1710 [Pseudomonadota bacterium]